MNNNIPQNMIDELKEVGIDLTRFPEDKRRAVCELYGYNFDNQKTKKQSEVQTKSYVPRLKKPINKQAAYVDALVLALVTGLFGGIFLTIVATIIN